MIITKNRILVGEKYGFYLKVLESLGVEWLCG